MSAVGDAGSGARGDRPRGDVPGEKFYRGRIVAVQYGSGTGILLTGNGREVRFAVPFVEFVGGRRIEDLTEGMEVGFDLGWTSRGLRVTKIMVD